MEVDLRNLSNMLAKVQEGKTTKLYELPSKELLRLENDGEDESELPGWDN